MRRGQMDDDGRHVRWFGGVGQKVGTWDARDRRALRMARVRLGRVQRRAN